MSFDQSRFQDALENGRVDTALKAVKNRTDQPAMVAAEADLLVSKAVERGYVKTAMKVYEDPDTQLGDGGRGALVMGLMKTSNIVKALEIAKQGIPIPIQEGLVESLLNENKFIDAAKNVRPTMTKEVIDRVRAACKKAGRESLCDGPGFPKVENPTSAVHEAIMAQVH